MAGTGWHGPNRQRRDRSRYLVAEAVAAMGDRAFTASDLVTAHRSVGTIRRYLDEMVAAGKVAEITGRKTRLLYRVYSAPPPETATAPTGREE